MARAKKAPERYVIDFHIPNRDRELLFNEDGTPKYTLEQLFEYAAKSKSDYASNFVPDVKKVFDTTGGISANQRYTLENIAVDYCPAMDELNKEFFVWYNSREDIQEIYKHSASGNHWWKDKNGHYISSDEAERNGWFDTPPDITAFRTTINGYRATEYRELKREVLYDVGDMVQLRKPYNGSWRRDPCYNMGLKIDEPRIGTVMEHKEQLDRKSRGGKGSRLINVLWLNNGQTVLVPERTIKKLPKQK